MPRAVLDPNVLVSGLISPAGPPAILVAELQAGAFELVVSPRLLAELEAVLLREKFRRQVTLLDVEEYVELIRQESILVDDPSPLPEQVVDDPNDAYLLALSRSSHVDVLVSGDRHLLRLRGAEAVVSPREFLDLLSD